MVEAGLPDFEVLNWDGIVVPSATSEPIRTWLGEAARSTLAVPSVITGFRRRGLEPWPTTERNFAAQVRADALKSQPLTHAGGIEPS